MLQTIQEVMTFDQMYKLQSTDVTRITTKDALYLPVGEVLLVRSENVPERGDHYVIITGEPVIKEHGLRPKTEDVIISEAHHPLLDEYKMIMGVILLKLKPAVRDMFLAFQKWDKE